MIGKAFSVVLDLKEHCVGTEHQDSDSRQLEGRILLEQTLAVAAMSL